MADRKEYYSKLEKDVKSWYIDLFTTDHEDLSKMRKKLLEMMDNADNLKIETVESHNFLIETIRTQIEVALDSIDNAIYQINEVKEELKSS